MPAKRKSEPTTAESSPTVDASSAGDDSPSSDASSAGDASSAVDPASGDASSAVDPASGEEEKAPLNRAERRARGKGSAPAQPTSRGKVVGRHGPAHTQRNWASRRSGG